jgi:hypothetical protein
VLNVFQGNELANVNASAHVGWGVAMTSGSMAMWGRKGMWIAVGANASLTLVHEACFHDGSPAEIRTDLTTRIGSTLVTAGLYELLHALHVIKWPGE